MSSYNRIVILAAAASLAMSLSAAPRHRAISLIEPSNQGGYASATSVAPGNPIRFHISTRSTPFTLAIQNLSDPRFSTQITNLQSHLQNCAGAFQTGCNWEVTTTFDVPGNWPSGYYSASFPTSIGTRNIIFVVRTRQPGSMAKTVIISPTNTYQAFNAFGGGSLNTPASTLRAARLSFNRPYQQDAGRGRYESWERRLVDWLRATNRPYEVVTDQDLEDSTLLGNYTSVILPGHSAYWTETARQNLETFSRNGGHIAVLGGNTMWFRIAYADNGRTLVGQTDAQMENSGEPGAIVTSNWYRAPINQPENRIVGTSFRNGGLANRAPNTEQYTMVPVAQRKPWTVTDPTQWVLAGTGLVRGAQFGRDTTGLEVDGVVFNCDINGFATSAEGSDEAPLNYHIVATTPASQGWGTLGYYVNSGGGAVFNAASQGWVWGLEFDEVVQRITANVLDRFAAGGRFPYDPVQTSIVTQDSFNCPRTLIEQAGWRTDGPRGTVTAGCAYEGPGGLELAGASQIGIARSLARAGESRDRVEVRLYLKADELQRRTDLARPVVTLQNRTGNSVQQVAHIELDVAGDTRRIRLARRGTDGSFAATDFITLTNGWHLVEASWRSPGTLSLQVDGGTVLTLENAFSGQTANELVVEYPAAQLSEGGRLCVDAIAAGTEKPGRVPALQ